MRPLTVYEEEHTAPPVHEKPIRILLIAVWFALVTGFIEVSLRAVQKFFLHQRVFVSPHIVWMAPLADVFVFVIPGFILSVVAWHWPRLISLRLATFIFAFLGFLGPLIMYPRLHRYAALLLAVGLAMQTTRLIVGHTHRFHVLVRHTLGWMIALVMGLVVVVYGWQVSAEHSALVKLPPAPPSCS